ncbi:hypothetical protein A6V39_05750 [Candidatus Mycoplasma haematobovis]|uniref:Uncharacterized protein n=1 Tax=Candidatus Mycoplasma haematobovis TaxID=432608 RepID=A0A1A9QDW2_9MOLU|nr:hypothetical protein [Candidatus Mycoplasma haematobovis]OAL10792.1 hypothetical protein A6V39_05750 [Candidatus Mycoplasma haematobovis]
MNRTSLLPAVVRMLTLSTIPPLTYLGVTQYNELNKIELPELPIEIEPEIVVKPSEPQKKIRKVWRQIAGRKFNEVFSSYYSSYKYTDGQLNSMCKSTYVYQIFRNWCKEAKFEIKEEEVK